MRPRLLSCPTWTSRP
uniref:Uncharacterized protein n=1 Tax=Anguilla anguilla TaxID=7936 RepID=A0A0E9V2G4_ANGAN